MQNILLSSFKAWYIASLRDIAEIVTLWEAYYFFLTNINKQVSIIE
jgi:hypothetical protein